MERDHFPKVLFYSTHKIQDFVKDTHSHQLSPCLSVMGTIPSEEQTACPTHLGLPCCHGVEHPWMCFLHPRAYCFHYLLLFNLNSCHKLPIASLVMSTQINLSVFLHI